MSLDPSDIDSQTALYARDLARLHAMRRAYERLVPAGLGGSENPEDDVALREATVLFTDIRGFTRIAERFVSHPETLLSVLNEHLTVVVRAITRCGGTVEKFLGDGVLATFGARTTTTDHRERALAAALGSIGAQVALDRARASVWGFTLPMAAAAATGPVVVGRIGPPERAEMGVLGDVINVAARLVAQAGPGEVLVDARLYHGLAGTVRADLLGPTVLRGRVGAVNVFRIAATRSAPA